MVHASVGGAARVPLDETLTLELGAEPAEALGYPTTRLKKGLVLVDAGVDLAEEGVGFGVPVLKLGARTVFPGRMGSTSARDGSAWRVTATYEMAMVERLAKARATGGDGPGALVESRALYAAKDALAALHRRAPALRRPLGGASAAVRRAFGWVTTYEQGDPCGAIVVTHVVRPGDAGAETRVAVTVDFSGLTAPGISGFVVMNEQGARSFDQYEDTDGSVTDGRGMGTWDEVGAAGASLVSTGHRVRFSLGQVAGARLFRGRELVGARLAWAGFGYVLPPTRDSFAYELTIARTS